MQAGSPAGVNDAHKCLIHKWRIPTIGWWTLLPSPPFTRTRTTCKRVKASAQLTTGTPPTFAPSHSHGHQRLATTKQQNYKMKSDVVRIRILDGRAASPSIPPQKFSARIQRPVLVKNHWSFRQSSSDYSRETSQKGFPWKSNHHFLVRLVPEPPLFY